MEKIGAYKVISSPNQAEFEALVNELIRNGWQPYGDATYHDLLFVQPMVKEEEERKKKTAA